MKKRTIQKTSPAKRKESFLYILKLIKDARAHAFRGVNTELITLYWRIGEYISKKIQTAEWGDAVVADLARYIQRHHPNLRGFTRASLFRMRQFFELYRNDKKVAPLVRQLSWSHNLIIMGRCKLPEEREYYLRLTIREHWSKRDLERQIDSGLFERAVLAKPKLSPVMREIHPDADGLNCPDIYVGDRKETQPLGVLTHHDRSCLCPISKSGYISFGLPRIVRRF
jgi:predicted nuclease of restriction endonuclease-like (RecB) superfamily